MLWHEGGVNPRKADLARHQPALLAGRYDILVELIATRISPAATVAHFSSWF